MRVLVGLAALAASVLLPLQAIAEPKSLPEATGADAATVSRAAAADSAKPSVDTAAAGEVVKPKPQPPAVIARINLSTQRMDVSVHGQPAHNWAISSGRSGYATPRGSFRVQWTSRMWYSRKYDNAPMPHAVFFNGGVAVHATSSVGMLGRPASHGCVRLAPAHAAQFYALVQRHGNANTRIEVFGSPSERIAERRERSRGGSDRAVEREVRRVSDRQPSPERNAAVARQNGMLFIGPGHSSYGQASFVQNGIRYVRIR